MANRRFRSRGDARIAYQEEDYSPDAPAQEITNTAKIATFAHKLGTATDKLRNSQIERSGLKTDKYSVNLKDFGTQMHTPYKLFESSSSRMDDMGLLGYIEDLLQPTYNRVKPTEKGLAALAIDLFDPSGKYKNPDGTLKPNGLDNFLKDLENQDEDALAMFNSAKDKAATMLADDGYNAEQVSQIMDMNPKDIKLIPNINLRNLNSKTGNPSLGSTGGEKKGLFGQFADEVNEFKSNQKHRKNLKQTSQYFTGSGFSPFLNSKGFGRQDFSDGSGMLKAPNSEFQAVQDMWVNMNQKDKQDVQLAYSNFVEMAKKNFPWQWRKKLPDVQKFIKAFNDGNSVQDLFTDLEENGWKIDESSLSTILDSGEPLGANTLSLFEDAGDMGDVFENSVYKFKPTEEADVVDEEIVADTEILDEVEEEPVAADEEPAAEDEEPVVPTQTVPETTGDEETFTEPVSTSGLTLEKAKDIFDNSIKDKKGWLSHSDVYFKHKKGLKLRDSDGNEYPASEVRDLLFQERDHVANWAASNDFNWKHDPQILKPGGHTVDVDGVRTLFHLEEGEKIYDENGNEIPLESFVGKRFPKTMTYYTKKYTKNNNAMLLEHTMSNSRDVPMNLEELNFRNYFENPNASEDEQIKLYQEKQEFLKLHEQFIKSKPTDEDSEEFKKWQEMFDDTIAPIYEGTKKRDWDTGDTSSLDIENNFTEFLDAKRVEVLDTVDEILFPNQRRGEWRSTLPDDYEATPFQKNKDFNKWLEENPLEIATNQSGNVSDILDSSQELLSDVSNKLNEDINISLDAGLLSDSEILQSEGLMSRLDEVGDLAGKIKSNVNLASDVYKLTDKDIEAGDISRGLRVAKKGAEVVGEEALAEGIGKAAGGVTGAVAIADKDASTIDKIGGAMDIAGAAGADANPVYATVHGVVKAVDLLEDLLT